MTFDTETMAELHATQGRIQDAVAIYRRLIDAASDDETRARRRRRIDELKQGRTTPPAKAAEPKPAPVAEPQLTLSRQGQQLRIEWAVPSDAEAAIVELLLVARTRDGVVTQQRSLPAGAPRGQQLLDTTGLHSARAALGRRVNGTFVPWLRAALDA